jgi:hypothetical protein
MVCGLSVEVQLKHPIPLFIFTPDVMAKKVAHNTHHLTLVKTLIELLNGGQAHATLSEAVKGLPVKLQGVQPTGIPYSIWQLVEHIRISQWDIVEFSCNPKYVSLPWPTAYWPVDPVPPNKTAWKDSIAQIDKDLKAFIKLLKAPDVELYTPFPWGTGQHLLREALLIADHTSYHTGEIIVIRRILGAWK